MTCLYRRYSVSVQVIQRNTSFGESQNSFMPNSAGVGILFLDVQKDFDKVWNVSLIYKHIGDGNTAYFIKVYADYILIYVPSSLKW